MDPHNGLLEDGFSSITGIAIIAIPVVLGFHVVLSRGVCLVVGCVLLLGVLNSGHDPI